jgi:hypothetical protein
VEASARAYLAAINRALQVAPTRDPGAGGDQAAPEVAP